MNWKAFALGAALAALSGGLQYAQALPSPYGALASTLLTVVTLFMASPRSKGDQ